MKKENENVENSAVALPKGRKMACRAFQSGILSLPLHNYLKKESDQSDDDFEKIS